MTDAPEKLPPSDGGQPVPGSTSGPRKLHTVVSSSTEISSWDAPIPPPEVFQAIEDIIPGGAERLLKAFEKETDHRHLLERRKQLLPFIDLTVARTFALIFAAGCLAAVVHAVNNNAPWTATVISGALVLAGINAFLRLQKPKK